MSFVTLRPCQIPSFQMGAPGAMVHCKALEDASFFFVGIRNGRI